MANAVAKSSAGFCNGVSFAGTYTTATVAASKAFSYTASGAGNAVVFWVAMTPSATSPTVVTLSATGWVFTQVGGIIDGGTANGCGAMFIAYAPNTSAATITVTWNQAVNQFLSNLIGEVSGADPTTIVDASNAASGTGTPTISVTPVSNDTLILVFCQDSVTAVGSIGGTTAIKGGDDTQQDWSEYRLLSGGAGVAQSCTVGGSGGYIIGAVAIRPAVAPTIGSVPSGTALATPAFTAKYLFFDTGDYSPGV